ncbi:MAG TPA: type II toxin-antitoxin system HipA family toxin [Solirubrobacter sp.]
MAEIEIDVLVDLGGAVVLAGRLWSHRRRNAESASFAYRDEYLTHPHAYELDPQLPLSSGQFQTALGRAMFGAFSDSAPDRWGRRLIHRNERLRATREGGGERSFGEVDFLLGVRDDLRQGALRYRVPGSNTFLADEPGGVPALLGLPKLLSAAEHLERDEASEEELRTLLRGGSSLGGARPKAHVIDADGHLAIAKFPSPATDEWDVIRWEAVALELARAAGLDVPAAGLHLIDGRPVLVIDRFDRAGTRRIGYVSAMTMLEAADGEAGSYLDIASIVEEQSPRTTQDLHQLWRRMAFSVLISNTDDHLRNHGFLRTSTAGWELSPAFDLNPDPRPGAKHLSTAIDDGATDARVDLLLEVAPMFRLKAGQAEATLAEVAGATDRWARVAQAHGLPAAGIEAMAPAFEHTQREAARAIIA